VHDSDLLQSVKRGNGTVELKLPDKLAAENAFFESIAVETRQMVRREAPLFNRRFQAARKHHPDPRNGSTTQNDTFRYLHFAPLNDCI
jgi:hypothetical protein